MIRWTAKDSAGRLMVGLGIDAENIKRLQDGKPIIVKGETIGLDMNIFIHYGENQVALVKQLKEAGIELPAVIQTHLHAAAKDQA